MTTREYGKSTPDPVAQAFAAGVVVLRATVRAQRPVRGIRLYDLTHDDGPETIPAAESLLRAAKDHSGHAPGTRVLVMLLGDGGAFIMGVRQSSNEQLADAEVSEPDANAARPPLVGVDDQTFEHPSGSRITFTHDGDIVITPKRSFRVESNGVSRLAVDGDADDSPVAGQPFLAWAQKVEAKLASHDTWIDANALTAPDHVHTPQVDRPPSPAADGDMLSERVLLPTGKGDVGGAP